MDDISYLSLEENAFKNFPKTLYQCTRLESLNMSPNDITTLKDQDGHNTFDNLRRLVTVDLSYNSLQDIIDIRPLNNLEKLNLSYNKISDISSNFLNNLPSHEFQLILKNNSITTLDINTFGKKSCKLTLSSDITFTNDQDKAKYKELKTAERIIIQS